MLSSYGVFNGHQLLCISLYFPLSKDNDSSALEEDVDSADYKAWEAKFRCTNLKSTKKPSVGTCHYHRFACQSVVQRSYFFFKIHTFPLFFCFVCHAQFQNAVNYC